MAYKYFKSEQVKVFPCSYRGYTGATSEQVPYDAEARMLTEHNFLHAGSNLDLYGVNGIDNTYVIKTTINNNVLLSVTCVIAGYYFELTNLNISFRPGDYHDPDNIDPDADYLYLAVSPTKEITIANGQTTKVLSQIENNNDNSQSDLHLDVNVSTDPNTTDYRFKGLALTNTNTDTGLIYLKLFNKKVTSNPYTCLREINTAVLMNTTKINQAEGDIVMTHKDQTINSNKTFTENIIINGNGLGSQGANTNKVDINVDTEITKAIIDNAEIATSTITNLNVTSTATIANTSVATATITNASIATATITDASIANIINDPILAQTKEIKRTMKKVNDSNNNDYIAREVVVPDYNDAQANNVLSVNASGTGLEWRIPYTNILEDGE